MNRRRKSCDRTTEHGGAPALAAVVRSLAAMVVLVGMGLSGPIAQAQSGDSPNPDSPGENTAIKITTVEGLTEYRLANGLQILLYPDPSKATVTVNATYHVGSRHEGRGEAGMAHLLEHMVFKGTPTFEDIWGALEDHGASFNGSTWVDRTNYYETLPASDENLEFALHMEADRMVNSRISAEDLASEMTVVRNEFEIGENNPIGVLSERMMSAAYLWHNYGKSTIGNRSDIERVPVENLRRFYKRYYQPDNVTLVVAGKFEVDKALGLIQRYFGAIPKPTRVLESTYTEEPAQDGPRMVSLNRVGDIAACGLMYHVPAGSHPDFAAVQVLQDVLTSQPAGRLYKAVVEPGMAANVFGSAYAWAEPGVLELMAEVRLEQDPRKTLDKMIEVVEGIGAGDITEKEVERIKTRRLKFIKMSMSDSGRVGVRMSEAIALGDWRMFFINRDRLKVVTAADVMRVARAYLLASNRTAGLFAPGDDPVRATVPPRPDVSAIVKGYEGTETVEQGEVFVATPETIDKRTKRITLQPGMKLALLSKETRGDAVLANFNFHFGTEEALTGHNTALSLIATLMMRGTKQRGHQELRDEIDRLQSQIRVSGGVGEFSASIVSDRAHLIDAITLLGEILQEPAFDQEEFDVVMKARLGRSEERLSDPQARGFNTLTRALNPFPKTSVHYVPTLEEQIARLKSVSLGTISELHKKFYGASNVEVSIVGDFDEKATTSALTKVFGSWKSPSRYERIAKPYLAVKPIDETILTPDKTNAIVATGAVIELRDDDPDFPALSFASYILGQSAKSRLLNRLRQKEGLSYGAMAFLQASSQEPRTTLMGFAMCAPQNAAKAQQSMREEMEKWIAEGITEEELSEGKNSYALQFDKDIASDRFVVRELVEGLEIDRTFAYHRDTLNAIEKLTQSDVQLALSKHFSDARFANVKAGDLEKKAP